MFGGHKTSLALALPVNANTAVSFGIGRIGRIGMDRNGSEWIGRIGRIGRIGMDYDGPPIIPMSDPPVSLRI
jgi:hypothetical protein